MALLSRSPGRLGRRSKRYAIKQLVTAHTPRHTHTSGLMVIPIVSAPAFFIALCINRLDSDSFYFKENSGQQNKLVVLCRNWRKPHVSSLQPPASALTH
jgi:hypothetical protein